MHTLFIFAGQPGSGKTTWSAHFAQQCQGCLIDIDAHFGAVVEAGLRLANRSPDDRDSEAFKKAFRAPIYCSMFALARDNLTHSHVVMNGPFTHELSQSDWPQQLAAQYQANVSIIYLTCDEQTLKTRLHERGLGRDKAKLAHWDTYQQTFKNAMTPACQHIRVNTGITDKEEWVATYLERWGNKKNGG